MNFQSLTTSSSGIKIFCHFSAILRLSSDKPVASGRENPSTRRRKEGIGFNVAFNSLGHIKMRQKPGMGKKLSSLHKKFEEIFELQKNHRQPSTMPPIYIANRPTRFWTQQRVETCELALGSQTSLPLGHS